jgi:Cof subfamily protein (haloacid dehalogenase superfamily)
VFDLDRTLLRTDKSISNYSIGILNECRARGIRIVFATARPFRTIRPFFDRIEPDALIYHNGAVIDVKKQIISKTSIENEDAKTILSAVLKVLPEATLSVEIDDVLYANFDVSIHWDNVSAKQTDFTDLPERPADKIIVGVSSMREIDAIAKVLPSYVYIEMSDSKLGLIMNKDATKLRGVQEIAKRWDIPLSEAIAFGDDYNDLEMLKACGLGIAVSNAIEQVKAASDHVCASNDDDGAARWLEENVLI